MDMLEINADIPVPRPRIEGFSIAVETALRQMVAGNSFAYIDETKSLSRSAVVRYVAKRLGIKVVLRKVGEREFRVWRTE